jgi:hypothetical protein
MVNRYRAALMALHVRQRLLLAFAAIHAVMFAYDLGHPERFLRTDRAEERLQSVQAFIDALQSGGDLSSFFATHGVPGDWLPQALLYLAGGQFLVIAVQIALVLASISCVYRIGRTLGLGEGGALGAAALYGALPHTLVFPHQLASEAIFVPLIVVGFAGLAGLRTGLAFGAATLIRPVTLLWPFVQVFLSGRSSGKAVFLAAALAPMLAWMGFIYVETGEVSMGRSGHDLGHNLYVRAHRMAAALPEAERPALKPAGQTTMGVREYLGFVVHHPAAAAEHSARDFATLAAKSGIERLAIDYLDLFPRSRVALQDSQSGWRAQIEQKGLAQALLGLWQAQAGLLLVSGVAAALFVAFMALAVVGAFSTDRARLLLAGFALYIFFTAQAVDAAQSRHRAPAEFALCLLAVAGWQRWRASAAARIPVLTHEVGVR